MSTVTFREALIRAMGDALEEDERVFLFGEDVAAAGGSFKLTEGLLERFGPKRVRDTPISEQAIIGTAIGSAVMGLRPLAEIMFADFAAVCFDGIANEIPKYRYMTGGQVTLPITLRMCNGAGGGFGAQHSQSVENWFLNVPGLKLVVPATPADAYGLLRSAVRDPNPVLFFEHKGLYRVKGEVPDDPEFLVPFGVAAVRRRGDALTVIATGMMVDRTLAAADVLAREGHEVEVIDPRTLVPLDMETILESVQRTGRAMIVHEAVRTAGAGAEIASRIHEELFFALDAPVWRLGAIDTPIPQDPELEQLCIPQVPGIVEAMRGLIAL